MYYLPHGLAEGWPMRVDDRARVSRLSCCEGPRTLGMKEGQRRKNNFHEFGHTVCLEIVSG